METIPNINELQAIKTRLEELQHTLNAFVIHPDMIWSDMLEKFNVLSGKYYNLSQLIQSTTLRNIVIQPVSVNAEHPEFVPNVLLRTKVEPELEQVLSNLLKQSEVSTILNTHDESILMKHLVDAQVRMKSFDALCQRLDEAMQDLRETIPLKLRIEDDTSTSLSANRMESLKALERILVAISSGTGLRHEALSPLESKT
jgi:RecG-like helicase